MKDEHIMIDTGYMNMCAHCNDCLDQIVAAPDKLNVLLHYRNEQGKVVEWNPPVKGE